MADLYKTYELGRSLEGKDIIHIARNRQGFVVFRAGTEQKLKKAIDQYEEGQKQKAEQEAKEAARRKAERERKKKQAAAETTTEATAPAPEEKPSEAPSITRGPDGKFISKSQASDEPPKKKSFWEKLGS